SPPAPWLGGMDRISRVAAYRTIPGASPTSIGRRQNVANLKLCRMAPMGRKAAPEQQRILPRQTMTSSSNGEDGFTLLEMVCILAIIAMLAAVLLPNIPRDTSRPRLEAYAVETA